MLTAASADPLAAAPSFLEQRTELGVHLAQQPLVRPLVDVPDHPGPVEQEDHGELLDAQPLPEPLRPPIREDANARRDAGDRRPHLLEILVHSDGDDREPRPPGAAREDVEGGEELVAGAAPGRPEDDRADAPVRAADRDRLTLEARGPEIERLPDDPGARQRRPRPGTAGEEEERQREVGASHRRASYFTADPGSTRSGLRCDPYLASVP